MLHIAIGFAVGVVAGPAFTKYAWPKIKAKLWSKTGSSLDA